MWNKAVWVGLPRSEAERWRIRHGAPGSRVRLVYPEKFTGDGLRKDDAEDGDHDGIVPRLERPAPL